MLWFLMRLGIVTSILCATICNAALVVGPNDVSSSSTKKPILVIGATGKLGRCIVSKLYERNIPYRCLVRKFSPNMDALSQYISPDAEEQTIFEGDLASFDDVRNAVCSGDGISQCIVVSGSFRKRRASDLLLPFRGGKNKIKDTSHPYIVNHIGMQHLCKAIHELNSDNGQDVPTTKIVKVSGALLSLPQWHYISLLGNMLYSGVMRWHKEGEKDVVQSGIPYTILRPGSFRDDVEFGHLKKELIVSEDGALRPGIKVKKPMIGINDLADICIECLESRAEWDNKVLYPKCNV